MPIAKPVLPILQGAGPHDQYRRPRAVAVTNECQKAETQEAKAIYKERKVIVEPVFRQIKNSGFRRFSLRGKEKVAGEFALVRDPHYQKNCQVDYREISLSGIREMGQKPRIKGKKRRIKRKTAILCRFFGIILAGVYHQALP